LLVPEVFGSAGPGANHQTERFTGADCADVLTGAIRRMGYGRVWHTHVAGLGRYARPVAGPAQLDEAGRTASPLTGVRAGDLIRIRYGTPGDFLTRHGWDHVAVLWEDRSDPAGPQRGGPDGRLDGFDLVVHLSHPRLVVEPLGRQLPARLDVRRWDERTLGRRATTARYEPTTVVPCAADFRSVIAFSILPSNASSCDTSSSCSRPAACCAARMASASLRRLSASTP
jgi:hypothetical protein